MLKPLAIFALTFMAVAGAPLGTTTARAQAAEEPPQPAPASPPGRNGGDMVSWVVLCNAHVALNVARLRKQLDEVFPGHFLPPRDKGNFVVKGSVPGQFLIQSSISGAAGVFLLHSIPAPYTEFSDFAAKIDDPALRRKAEAQCCWLSVDLIARHTSNEDAYRFIGRVLAKVAPADAAVLVHPTRGIAIAFDDGVRSRLASGQLDPRL